MRNIINMISSTISLVRSTSQYAHTKTTEYIEENIIKDNYVTREEYNNLYQLVVELKYKLDQVHSITKSKKSN